MVEAGTAEDAQRIAEQVAEVVAGRLSSLSRCPSWADLSRVFGPGTLDISPQLSHPTVAAVSEFERRSAGPARPGRTRAWAPSLTARSNPGPAKRVVPRPVVGQRAAGVELDAVVLQRHLDPGPGQIQSEPPFVGALHPELRFRRRKAGVVTDPTQPRLRWRFRSWVGKRDQRADRPIRVRCDSSATCGQQLACCCWRIATPRPTPRAPVVGSLRRPPTGRRFRRDRQQRIDAVGAAGSEACDALSVRRGWIGHHPGRGCPDRGRVLKPCSSAAVSRQAVTDRPKVSSAAVNRVSTGIGSATGSSGVAPGPRAPRPGVRGTA